MILFYYPSYQWLTTVNSTVPPSSGTICYWLLNNALLGQDETAWHQNTNFYISTTVEPRIRVRLGRTTELLSTITMTVGLYHIACTYNSSTGYNAIYINGVLNISDTGTGSTLTSNVIRMGSNVTSEWMDGSLEDVRMYDRILSDDEIFNIYSLRGVVDSYEGLVHRYLMEGVPGAVVGTVYDLGSRENPCTSTGNPVYQESVLRGWRRPLSCRG